MHCGLTSLLIALLPSETGSPELCFDRRRLLFFLVWSKSTGPLFPVCFSKRAKKTQQPNNLPRYPQPTSHAATIALSAGTLKQCPARTASPTQLERQQTRFTPFFPKAIGWLHFHKKHANTRQPNSATHLSKRRKNLEKRCTDLKAALRRAVVERFEARPPVGVGAIEMVNVVTKQPPRSPLLCLFSRNYMLRRALATTTTGAWLQKGQSLLMKPFRKNYNSVYFLIVIIFPELRDRTRHHSIVPETKCGSFADWD